MQTAVWYWNRLRSMPLPEVWWRMRGSFQQTVDRLAMPLRSKPLRISRITGTNGLSIAPRVETVGARPALVTEERGENHGFGDWAKVLIAQADRICRNRLSIFDLEDHDLGPEIDWNFEYSAKKKAPMGFAPRIDYRDYTVTGDARVVWEPNRHHHLVVLGWAYRLTGNKRYAEKVVEQIDGWITQCPFGRGMNWRSPLELAIRLINWVWAFDLIAPSGVLTRERWSRFLPVVYRHLWDIQRKYSCYSSANNHLIGEAAGVFIGSHYFAGLKNVAAWTAKSQAILTREIVRQTYDDGGNREQTLGYHLFATEFFLLTGVVGRAVGADFPQEYWDRLERMFDFVAAFAEGGDSLPSFGDSDDGHVLDLGGRGDRARALLAIGAVLFERNDFKALSDGHDEAVFWLLGEDGHRTFQSLGDDRASHLLRSRALPASGHYLLQAGHRKSSDRISVTFDCGDLGFGSIAAHGHADALSITLRAFGEDILVDPGTYDYFRSRRWRDYFRSTRAHNTITVDERDQSEMLGSFLWGRRAGASCSQWRPSSDGGSVTGEHDGYTRLADPVTHRRTVTLDGDRSEVILRDELVGAKRHEATLYLHFAEHCQVREVERNEYEVTCGLGTVTVRIDPQLKVQLFRGSEEPMLGWVSRGYHRKSPSTTLVARSLWTGEVTLVTRIDIRAARLGEWNRDATAK